MRLINCETGKLEWFSVSEIVKPPPYAILSHTWDGDTEVTYQDYIDYLAGLGKKPQKNWSKVEKSIEITRSSKEGLKYIWIDTCCINKTDISELGEAINSMFNWYNRAVVCYAQIADFAAAFMPISQPSYVYDSNNTWQAASYDGQSQSYEMSASLRNPQLDGAAKNRLRSCRWFTRGWTLQELIAPSRVEFFDGNWTHFGNRDELSDLLTSITHIDKKIFKNSEGPHQKRNLSEILGTMTIAKKMSWAQNRQTSKTEDIAYSLLGIFGVNMDMRYGEESKAFTRLQKEILMGTNDLSIFAWTASASDDSGAVPEFRGILAHSPSEFAHCGSFEFSRNAIANPEFTLTNLGLKISAQVRDIPSSKYLFLSLNCFDGTEGQQNVQGITVQMIGFAKYKRTNPSFLITELSSWPLQPRREFWISSTDTEEDTKHLNSSENQRFVFVMENPDYYEKTGVSHYEAWDESEKTFSTHGLSPFTACVKFKSTGMAGEKVTEFLVACGIDSAHGDPWFCMVRNDHAVYRAASDENWDLMGQKGRQEQKTDYSNASSSFQVDYAGREPYKDETGLKMSVRMVKEKETNDFRVIVLAEQFDHSTCATNCHTFCFDTRTLNPAHGCCVIS